MKQIIQAIGLLFVFGIGVPSFAQTFTSEKHNTESSDTASATSVNTSAAGTMAVSTGDFILACVGTSQNSQSLDGLVVSDGGSNTLTCDTASAGPLTGQLWLCRKPGATANATATWTATWTGTHAFRSIHVANYSGLTDGSLDQGTVCQNTANCTTEETGTTARDTVNLPTTTNASDLLLGCMISDANDTYTAANGFTLRGGASLTTVDRFIAEKAVSSTGTYGGSQGTGALTTPHFLMKLAAFKVTTGGGGGGGATVNKRAKLEKMYSALKTQISGMGAVVAAIPTLDPLTGMFVWRGDLTHQSADTTQTILTTTNVTGTSFKKTWQFATADADIKTQPLIAANVRFSDKVRNVTYIASMANTAYALDADTGQLLWKTDLNAGEAPANATDVMSCNDVIGTVGVISSGAIDPITRTIYYLAKTEVAGPTFKYRMHALDIVTGAERPGSPVLVTATVAGTGAGSSGGNISLDPHHNNNTSGAVIANGLIYFTFSSHCDDVPYHGWIIAYDLKTFQQKYAWANAPNSGTSSSKEGGPWMSGAPPAIDEFGNLYVTTGCADFNGTDAFGQSLIKLSPTLTVLDYFTPFDWATMNTNDYDLGASGVTLLPDQPNGRLVVHGGKAHNLYVESRDNLGHNHASDNNQITQYIAATFPGTDFGDNGMFATPLYWNGKLYFCIADTTTPRGCQMRTITNGVVASSASSTTGDICHVRTCGGFITSTGLTNGIFWMYDNDTSISKARLYAYDATNLATKLYDSEANAARDSCPMAGSKWTNPTVYKGKVYIVGTTGICAYANF